MSIGENIQKYRKDKKLTQQELADKIGISKSHMSKIEINNKKPSLELLFKIAEKLNVSLYDLTGQSDFVKIIDSKIQEVEKRLKETSCMMGKIPKTKVLNENVIKQWFVDDVKSLIEETLKTEINILRYNRNDFTESEIQEIGYFVYLAYNTKINEILSRKKLSDNEYDKDIFKY